MVAYGPDPTQALGELQGSHRRRVALALRLRVHEGPVDFDLSLQERNLSLRVRRSPRLRQMLERARHVVVTEVVVVGVLQRPRREERLVDLRDRARAGLELEEELDSGVEAPRCRRVPHRDEREFAQRGATARCARLELHRWRVPVVARVGRIAQGRQERARRRERFLRDLDAEFLQP